MTDKTHTHNISDPGHIPEGGITTRGKQKLALLIERQIKDNIEDSGQAHRYAVTLAILEKSIREADVFNTQLLETAEKKLQKQDTHDQPISRTPEEREAAINRIADKIYARRRARYNA